MEQDRPPCVLFEDDDLLMVNKPAGLNTHAPSPYAGEGIYEWLKNREPRWSSLAIVQRLDKDTSGVIVFPKTPRANRSLTGQFMSRTVRKTYVLVTDRKVPGKLLKVKTVLVRAGEKYLSRPVSSGETAETVFQLTEPGSAVWKEFDISLACASGTTYVVLAQPLTGRTHQIRVHAAENGFPILGDVLYGGTPAPRLHLHAARLEFNHPETGKKLTFNSRPDFQEPPSSAIRRALIDETITNGFRLVHGASDQRPGRFVDRFGDYLLSQSSQELAAAQLGELQRMTAVCYAKGAYHKVLKRQVRHTSRTQTSPRLVAGTPAPAQFVVLENGLKFELSFAEGYSVGLFLDQRDNRRRLLTGYIAPDFWLCPRGAKPTPGSATLLNMFAYTCAFSVCAAKAGLRTTSVDLSKKYLEWGRRNFVLNGIDPEEHEFIYGDTFDWLRRLVKKGRRFDVVLLDPPTFSQSKVSGAFKAERDFGELVKAALPLLEPGGVLFASSNAESWPAEAFQNQVQDAVRAVGRRILLTHYSPQPPDFPISRAEPAYLKTTWLRIGL